MSKTKKTTEPLRIGILRGQENSFPEGLIANINRVAKEKGKNIVAEFIKIGGLKMAEETPYTVILDRISHEIPHYRAYLKLAVLGGTYIVNNPFGGVPTINFSIIRLPRKWESPFRKRLSCRQTNIRQTQPLNLCATWFTRWIGEGISITSDSHFG